MPLQMKSLGILLVAVVGEASYVSYSVANLPQRSQMVRTSLRCSAPVCLNNPMVISKLNEVPVFAVANGVDELMAAPDAETGKSVITFHIDVAEAKELLAGIQEANPTAALKLTVAPLGTAFLMSKMEQDDAVVRIQPSQAVLNGVRKTLGFKAEDPESGAQQVPLFGSDELNFEIPVGPENPKGGEMTPLFFSVDDFRSAWIASGQPADKLPPLSLTDLRTLAYNMEKDSSKDWSSILLIAPEAGIAFVKGEAAAAESQQQQQPASKEPATPELTPADVQGLVFGEDDSFPIKQRNTPN